MKIIENVPIQKNARGAETAPLLPDPNRKKNFLAEHRYLLWCMLIPAALMYLIYLARGIHPFGNGSVLVLDLNAQYVWFFEALRRAVFGDASLLYSFSRALGGEFLGIYAYYLASPFSYLVCLFPETKMLEALLTIFLLKTAICGATFGYYMHRTLKDRRPFAIVMFATLYALTSYAVVQQHNTMWIDAVMWLPLITLGIEELIKHGKYKMYTVFLALTLFSNFYIGFMVCIYTFVYFFLYYIAHNEKGRNNPYGESRHFIKSLFRIAFFSMIALGIAAVILLGAYYALNFGKTTFSTPKWQWTIKMDILDLLYKFLPGSYDTVRPEGYPFVYCGILTLLLTPAYFFSKKYPMRQKVISVIFILFFVASFSISVLDLIWHAFQNPNWLNYRYSFMLCFYLCVLACRAFAEFETVSLKVVMGTGGLIAIVCAILQKYTDNKYVKPDDYTCIWFTIAMVIVYIIFLGILRMATTKRGVSVLICIIVCLEVFLNGLWNMNALDDDVTYSTYDRYNDFLNSSRPIIEEVQKADTSFYRMEKTFFRKTNDNMALGMNGLSGSTSTLNKETIQFLNKMGYASKSHWSKYLGGNPVNDSLLGLKYIVSADNIYGNYYEVFKTDPENGYTAYYNPYALSIAYGVDEDLLDFPLGFVPLIEDPTDESEKKDSSAIADAIAAVKNAINSLLDIDETINTAEYMDKYDSPFERLNAMVTAMLGENRTVKIFVPVRIQDEQMSNLKKDYSIGHYKFVRVNEGAESSLTYTVRMPESAELFFYMPSDYPKEVKLMLSTNGSSAISKGTFHGGETSRIISLGMHDENDTVSLAMKLTTNNVYPMIGENYFYYIDWEVFEDAMARLAQDQYQITEFTDTSFKGTFTPSREHELVMTTIAYDKGWKVLVDGVEVETVKALGSLVSFYVDGSVGETHTVEIIYAPNTFPIGITISLISLALLLLLFIFEKPMKKRPFLRAIVSVPVPPRSVFDVAEEEEAKRKAAAAKDDEEEEIDPDAIAAKGFDVDAFLGDGEGDEAEPENPTDDTENETTE